MITRVKTAGEIKFMRYGGQVLSGVLKKVSSSLEPGMNGSQINEIAEKELEAQGVKPAFLGFQGFPASICVSINDEIVHGIPSSDKVIKNGDLVSLDLGVEYNSMIVDGAITVIVGNSPQKDDTKYKLLKATKSSLYKGLKSVKPGCKVGDISSAIQAELESHSLGIIKELVGHGVGHELHEEPNIPNYGKKGAGMKLLSGMTIAVEPMATLGEGNVYVDDDGWTVKTSDGSMSAQFEHTVLITDSGCEILTNS